MMRGGFRRGPGLVRTVARTAVIAGTATAVSGGVARRQAARADQKAQAQQAEAMAAQQQAVEQVPAAAPPAGDDMVAMLQQLAQLHDSGVLSDAEFEAAKSKLLA
jgi:hypothetical protein